MRLVHVLPTFGLGGTELRVTSLINGLGSEFSHSIIPLNGVETARDRISPNANIQVFRSSEAAGPLRSPLQLYRVLRRLRPDLLLTYNWGAMNAVLAARVGGLCPIIHNECGFGPDEAICLKKRRVIARRLLLNTIAMTIVVSSTLERIALERYRIRRNRLRFIQTGVDTERFAPRRNEALRRELKMPGDRLVVGYVGGLRPEKNVSLLVESFAAAQIPKGHLLIVGDGPLRRDLERLTARLEISEHVTFAGSVTDTAPYYNAMDVFAMSSSTEQTPNALLEAMASGLPAVCTAVGDTIQLLGPKSSCAIPLGNSDQYVKWLQDLSMCPALRQSLGQLNRERCMLSYSRETMMHSYKTAYLSALGPSRSVH